MSAIDCFKCSNPVNSRPVSAFYPGLDRYDVWRVDFSIPIHIGESIWESKGVTPTAWFSWSPEIGSAHSSAYQEILP